MAFALSGTVRFLASLRNDSGGSIAAVALPGTTRFPGVAPNCKSMASALLCQYDQIIQKLGQGRYVRP